MLCVRFEFGSLYACEESPTPTAELGRQPQTHVQTHKWTHILIKKNKVRLWSKRYNLLKDVKLLTFSFNSTHLSKQMMFYDIITF